MKELVKITEKKGIKSVSARELHEKLEIQTQFKDWFPRICEYGFKEGVDYSKPLKNEQVRFEGSRQVKREVVDYAISIDMAKHICMLQRSEVGMKVRNYFLRCEKELERIYKTRDKSKKIRNNFTDTLQEHGYTKPHEYIQTTQQMKQVFGITKKKKDMTDKEIKLVMAGELLADCMIDEEYGFNEVNPVCLEASTDVLNLIEEKKLRKLANKNKKLLMEQIV